MLYVSKYLSTAYSGHMRRYLTLHPHWTRMVDVSINVNRRVSLLFSFSEEDKFLVKSAFASKWRRVSSCIEQN